MLSTVNCTPRVQILFCSFKHFLDSLHRNRGERVTPCFCFPTFGSQWCCSICVSGRLTERSICASKGPTWRKGHLSYSCGSMDGKLLDAVGWPGCIPKVSKFHSTFCGCVFYPCDRHVCRYIFLSKREVAEIFNYSCGHRVKCSAFRRISM